MSPSTVRKLSKVEQCMLVAADRFGEVRPTSKQQVEACVRLLSDEFLGEHDAAPGVYFITCAGERELERRLALVKL